MSYLMIDHPAMACRDVAGLADWYCTHLGMRVIHNDKKAPPTIYVGYGDTFGGPTLIELMPARDAGPSPETFARFQPGFRHLALRVSDFDSAYARLERLGVEFLFEPTVPVGGGKVVSFRDPEGNEIQIVQRSESKSP